MLRILIHELYGSVPASFPAKGSVEQAARALGAATPRWGLTFRRSGIVAGRVSVQRVVLRRVRPSANPFAPEFRGRFMVESGRVVLSGRFALNPFVQAFLTAWFAFLGFASLAGLITGAVVEASPWAGMAGGFLVAVAALGVAFVGFLLLRFSKGLTHDDPEHISSHVREAFEDAAA